MNAAGLPPDLAAKCAELGVTVARLPGGRLRIEPARPPLKAPDVNAIALRLSAVAPSRYDEAIDRLIHELVATFRLSFPGAPRAVAGHWAGEQIRAAIKGAAHWSRDRGFICRA